MSTQLYKTGAKIYAHMVAILEIPIATKRENVAT